MGLINNEKLYPQDVKISLKDKFIGSDNDKNGKTNNYSVEEIYDFINVLNGKKAANYKYSTNEADTTIGVFNITGTTFKFNEKDSRNIDNTDFFNILKNNKELILLSLKSGVNDFNYFKISSVTQHLNSFSFVLSILGTTNVNDLLLDKYYNLGIDVITQSGAGNVNVQSDWNESDAALDTFIKNKPNTITQQQSDAIIENTAKTGITSSERTKLAGLESSKFLGQYVSLNALQIANPSPVIGSYAYVDAGAGSQVSKYIWDSSDSKYHLQASSSTSETPSSVKQKYESNSDTNAYTDVEKTKLSSISNGAEVNVQSDWNETNAASNTFIQNKPTLQPTSVKTYGAIGDGVADDTVAIQLALTSSNNVFFPTGVYISSTLNIINDDTRIHGNGVSSVIKLKTGDTGYLVECASNRVVAENLLFSGGSGTSQRSVTASTANRNGLSVSSQRNSIIQNCTFEGFENIGLGVNDLSNTFLERFLVDGCIFKKCWSGLDTGSFGEYTRYANCQIVDCAIGITIRSGNINVNNFVINKNGIGVFLQGNVANDGHGSVNNSLINHNDYAVLSIDVINGFLFTGNNFFEGIFEVRNSTGINIVNNIVNLTSLVIKGGGADSGMNYFINNKMFPSYGNAITRASGGLMIIQNNYFDDGSFLEDKTVDGNILMHSNTPLIRIKGVGSSFGIIELSRSNSGTKGFVTQTDDDVVVINSNNVTKGFAFTNGNGKALHITGTGYVRPLTGYRSSDDSIGATTSVVISGVTLNFKDGLFIS